MNKKIILDIETAPDLEAVERFWEPFDPDKVKVGNMGKEKAEAKIEEARANHDDKQRSEAALIPHKANIVSIGMHFEDSDDFHLIGVNDLIDEKTILDLFWIAWRKNYHDSVLCYYGGSERGNPFDPRMIIHRSWAVDPSLVPAGMITKYGFHESFVDLAPIYLKGDYSSYCSANDCANRLGLIGQKVAGHEVLDKRDLEENGVGGANYHEVLKEDPAKAELYLTNDLAMERLIQQVVFP